MVTLPILLRAEEALTIARLAHAWAPELPGAEADPPRCERALIDLLVRDALNGRFDNAGPLREGERLGLRQILPDYRVCFLKGEEVKGLISICGNGPFLWNRILLIKKAALDFSSRRQLPL